MLLTYRHNYGPMLLVALVLLAGCRAERAAFEFRPTLSAESQILANGQPQLTGRFISNKPEYNANQGAAGWQP